MNSRAEALRGLSSRQPLTHRPRGWRWSPASRRATRLPLAALGAIAAGGVAWRLGDGDWAALVWLAGLLATGAPVLTRTAAAVARGRFATDVIAALAIVAALLLREPLAGLIVVLMQTGGEALERYAEGRASDAVRALEDAAPRVAHRMTGPAVEDIAVEQVAVGDLLLVRPGEVVPADGEIVAGRSQLDTSRLTGEAAPREADPGVAVMSGMLNGDGAFTLRATARSRESQYARIVELVRSAEASKSPLQRLANRYAAWFTPFTVLLCAITWLLTGDATRVLAVLVVATPCPLILATPIAIIGGINRAATRQIIVRNGGALERLSDVRVAVFDKTGTVTEGRPSVRTIRPFDGVLRHDLLRLAGALEQHAGHLLARSLADTAIRELHHLPAAEEVVETPGRGVEGVVEGRRVVVGARSFVLARLGRAPARPDGAPGTPASLRALVAIDGALAGEVEYDDQVRPETAALLAVLPSLGVTRTVLLSGDHAENVRETAAAVGFDEAAGDLLPGDKVARVAELSQRIGTVMMVGDGTNDAPALSQADVGVALAGHGGGITSEAADVVILVDDLARVGDAMRIARRTMRIARQSIGVGLGLGGVGMMLAAFGHLPPIAGAMLQEVIDVAVILNALRARRAGA